MAAWSVLALERVRALAGFLRALGALLNALWRLLKQLRVFNLGHRNLLCELIIRPMGDVTDHEQDPVKWVDSDRGLICSA